MDCVAYASYEHWASIEEPDDGVKGWFWKADTKGAGHRELERY